ncbi:DNA polymerase [bacterium]|nr:DNA polymerase [bacterium]
MNSYYASVEQELTPQYLGKPVGVVPTMVDTSCCIATSYEAKAFGVKTGTLISEARKKCPDIILVEARPQTYVTFHHRIKEAVDSCIPIATVRSIDEMDCRLMGKEREPDRALTIASNIKQAIREKVGRSLKCSVGVAPNTLLAKIAAEMHKPDGLTIIKLTDLPDILYSLELQDIPGIGPRMYKRLTAAGLQTVEQLCRLSKNQMSRHWGGIIGERLWHWLRGDNVPEPATHKNVVGHSHVLAPEFRNETQAYAVVQKLLHKAALRLRKMGLWAKALSVHVSYLDRPPWEAKIKLNECQDDLVLLAALKKLWEPHPKGSLLAVSVHLSNLIPNKFNNLSLFDDPKRKKLVESMDEINAKFGIETVYFGSIHDVKGSAPTRIGFTNVPDIFW